MNQTSSTGNNSAPDQTAVWNGPSGNAWAELQPMLDRMFTPLEELLAGEAAEIRPASLLDIGCGCGSTTLAAARALGESGRCTGIDISEPMLAVARARALEEGSTANFLYADAQNYEFEPASFDLLLSRFGVMFFSDPVAAFANLHRASQPGAQTRLITWRSPAENPFMTTAERAAAPLLPSLPPRDPNAPGQFGLSDRDRVARILNDAGWSDAAIDSLDVACEFPESALEAYCTRLGPVGALLLELEESMRSRVADAVRSAFAPFVKDGVVRFSAACWMIRAHRRS